MGLRAVYQKHRLQFKFEAGTSRGVLTSKDTYFVKVFDKRNPAVSGLGECAPLQGLSVDDVPGYENFLKETCEAFSESGIPAGQLPNAIIEGDSGNKYPSIQFGFETALLDLHNGGNRIIYPGLFTEGKAGISINGLIWMGSGKFMKDQIQEKILQGYTCLKMKIGAIDFEKECEILASLRKNYPADQITLRVDANGAFDPENVLEKLNQLSAFDIHSIEQPIQKGQPEQMASLCKHSPVPVALDEELIGVMLKKDKQALLKKLMPPFIILKPTLLGGFRHCLEWIQLANELNIGWWITSALESNIGLNAISQFTATLETILPQGLGTGQLFTNNIDSPLEINRGQLFYNKQKGWDLRYLKFNS